MEEGLAVSKYLQMSPEQLAKITRSLYGDYDYGASSGQDFRGHYSDIGKLPNHPTFSKESKYSSDKYQGGDWVQIGINQYKYIPSQDMVKAGNTSGLAEYFNKYEPTAVLEAPPPYNSREVFK